MTWSGPHKSYHLFNMYICTYFVLYYYSYNLSYLRHYLFCDTRPLWDHAWTGVRSHQSLFKTVDSAPNSNSSADRPQIHGPQLLILNDGFLAYTSSTIGGTSSLFPRNPDFIRGICPQCPNAVLATGYSKTKYVVVNLGPK